VRQVRSAEPEKGQNLKEGFIKAITGGEEFLVRRMQQEFIEVTPEFKLTISGNHKPEIRGTDAGIWRRVLLVPFMVSIPDEDVDALLPKKLWEERAGILNWMLAGLEKWLTDGLKSRKRCWTQLRNTARKAIRRLCLSIAAASWMVIQLYSPARAI